LSPVKIILLFEIPIWAIFCNLREINPMISAIDIPVPLLFNPLKHHLGFIRHFIEENTRDTRISGGGPVLKELKHIGGSVMDIYSGDLTFMEICDELLCFLNTKRLSSRERFSEWAGIEPADYKSIYLSDGSQWVMKYYANDQRFVHSFPARFSPHSFRIKANTLKSAVLYQIFIGKDFVSEENLNTARALGGLSPVKDVMDTEAISEMIEILRG